MTSGAVRSETWSLIAPNPGTANVTVTLSGPAPVIAGATSFAGVDQFSPIIVGSSGGIDNGVSNSASFVTNGTVAKDGMFGTIVISPASQTGGSPPRARSTPSSPTTAGRTSTGHDPRRRLDPHRLHRREHVAELRHRLALDEQSAASIPYAFTWLALKAATGSDRRRVTRPRATNITSTSATLGGTMASTGGATITRRGVVYCRARTRSSAAAA